jgi:hypothetical protein
LEKRIKELEIEIMKGNSSQEISNEYTSLQRRLKGNKAGKELRGMK